MDKVCFLISPIGKDGSVVRTNADEVMKYIVEPACATFNYKVIRADKMSNTGLITKAIIEQIISADIVIADLTDNNPNVFYELAIRHSYRKPAIQIVKGEVNIPFDIANMRTISYDTSLSGAESAKKEIKAMMSSIENGEIVHNPVSEVSTENAELLSKLLLEVQQIPESLNILESNIETRFSQMLSAFIESIRVEGDSNSLKTEDRMLEIFMKKFMDDPQKGMQSFDAMLQLQDKLNNKNNTKK